MKNPFKDEHFIKKVAEFSRGRVYSLEPIPIVYKGFLLRRAYSLPYGFYGGFVDNADITFLKSALKKFIRFYIYDFENRIQGIDFMDKKEVYTYILEVPNSFEDFLKAIHYKRYRSMRNLYNRAKRYNVNIVEGFDYFDRFYRLYEKVYSKHHRIIKKYDIIKLSDFLRLINVISETYIGGLLIIKLKQYALLWLIGYESYKNFSVGEFLLFKAVEWAIDNKIEILDFGLETTESVGFIKQSFGTIKYRYNVWYKG